MNSVQVIKTVQRPRRCSSAEKKSIVEDAERPGMSMSAVARKYDLHPNQLFKWRRLLHEGARSAVKAGEGVVPVSEGKELRARIREMERLLGRKTMEAEILRDAVRIASEKN
jgi:transposase